MAQQRILDFAARYYDTASKVFEIEVNDRLFDYSDDMRLVHPDLTRIKTWFNKHNQLIGLMLGEEVQPVDFTYTMGFDTSYFQSKDGKAWVLTNVYLDAFHCLRACAQLLGRDMPELFGSPGFLEKCEGFADAE